MSRSVHHTKHECVMMHEYLHAWVWLSMEDYIRKCNCAWMGTCVSVTAHGMRHAWAWLHTERRVHDRQLHAQERLCIDSCVHEMRVTMHGQLHAWVWQCMDSYMLECDNAWTVTCMSVIMHGQLHARVWQCMDSYMRECDCAWIVIRIRLTAHE